MHPHTKNTLLLYAWGLFLIILLGLCFFGIFIQMAGWWRLAFGDLG